MWLAFKVVDDEEEANDNDVEKSNASLNDQDSDGTSHCERGKMVEEMEDDDRWISRSSGLTRRLSSFTSTDDISNVGLLSGDKEDAEVIGSHLLRNGPKRGEDLESV